MSSPAKWVGKSAVFSLLTLVLVAGYYAQSHHFKSAFSDVPIEPIACDDLMRGCDVDGMHIKFDHLPQVMQPFHLQLQAADAQSIFASFAMVGMQMGPNRYRLLQQASGDWIAEIILPVCVQSRSDWLLEIEITKANAIKRYQLAFTSSGGRARLFQPE